MSNDKELKKGNSKDKDKENKEEERVQKTQKTHLQWYRKEEHQGPADQFHWKLRYS